MLTLLGVVEKVRIFCGLFDILVRKSVARWHAIWGLELVRGRGGGVVSCNKSGKFQE